MITKIINRILNVSLICVFAILLVMTFTIKDKTNNKNFNADEEPNLLIAAGNNVSIYVSGNHVDNLLSSEYLQFGTYSNNFDKYATPIGNKVTLSAINENKIFTEWNIFDSSDYNVDLCTQLGIEKTNPRVKFYYPENLTGDLVVVPKYKQTISATDHGLYFFDPFVLEEADDFDALSRIVNNESPSIEDYARFDVTPGERGKIISGYFKITRNLTLNSTFKSIGSLENPFCGKIDGNSEGENSIISINQITEVTTTDNSGNFYGGLFGALSEYDPNTPTIVRNINMQGSISLTEKFENPNMSSGYDNAFLGGLSGVSGHGVILDNCESKVTISADTVNTNVYAGGFFGYSYTSIDQNRNINLIADHNKWSINTHSLEENKGNIYLGGYTGYLSNAYIYDFHVYSISFISITLAAGYGDAYVGGIVGYYDYVNNSINNNIVFDNLAHIHFTNAHLVCTDEIIISAQSNNGNTYVGGLIGRLNADALHVTIANISFQGSNESISKLTAATKDANSYGDVFLGGIIGYVDGMNANYDENYITRFEPIFKGKINMIAEQKGKSDSLIGRAVAGGFVGKGYINVNNSRIFLNSENSEINLNIIQNASTKNVEYSTSNQSITSIFEHISGGIFAGSFGTGTFENYPIDNFVIVANNFTLKGIRQQEALSHGQITIGGLVGFSNRLNISNVKILLNNCNLHIDSLSKELKITKDFGNNAYLGGVVGRYYGNDVAMAEMSDTIIAGYNYPEDDAYVYDENNIGLASCNIKGVQDTQAGGKDYLGEIYVGGFVGSSGYSSFRRCKYLGSSVNQNLIYLTGNNNVDSAMVGGLIGLVRAQYKTNNVTIEHCEIKNVFVNAQAQSTTVSNPDIYVGGLVGAVFMDGRTDCGDVYIRNNYVHDCEIEGLGRLDMKTYVGGVVGGVCWTNVANIDNNISYNNKISSIVGQAQSSGKFAKAYAGGVVGFSESPSNISISNCASINNIIFADYILPIGVTTTNSQTYAGGIFGRTNTEANISVTNSYVNSSLDSRQDNHTYVVGSTVTSSNTNYYNGTKMSGHTVNGARSVTFDEVDGIVLNSDDILHDGLALDVSNPIPYTNVVMSNSEIFNTTSESGVWGYQSTGEIGSSYANLWVKIINNDFMEPSYENGWVRLGRTKLVTENATGYSIDVNYDSYNDDHYTISQNSEDIVIVKLNPTIDNLTFTVNGYDNANSKIADNMTIIESYSSSYDTKVGSFEFENSTNGICYVKFTPTSDYYDSLESNFDLYFECGDNVKTIKFKIITNSIDKMQGTYSESTLPLDYVGQDEGLSVGEFTYGSENNPFVYCENSTIKIIPAFNRRNIGDVILDSNNKYVTYKCFRLDKTANGSINAVSTTIKESGELEVGNVNSGTRYRVDITLRDIYNLRNLETTSVYISILDSCLINTNLKGADYIGPQNLGIYNSEVPYNLTFDILPRSGFSGIPQILTISFSQTESYNLLDGIDVENNITIVNSKISNLKIINLETGLEITTNNGDETIIDWTNSNEGYRIIIPSNYITQDVDVDIEFNLVYTLMFNINIDNDKIPEERRLIEINSTSNYSIASLINATRTSNVVDGVTRYQYSLENSILDGFEQYADLGYTLHGWYLIEDASFVASYGNKIEEILAIYADNNNGDELKLNSNYTFYARWSFSIFLNEAPGTTVKCTFPDNFMYKDKYNVDVPINNKRGFSFSIIKSDGFSGLAEVEAHILTSYKDSNDKIQYELTPIELKRHHENNYIYIVEPEDINGLLVITTYSNHLEYIVGENEDSIEMDISPEDGVYTLRYITNHLRNSTKNQQTYAFNNLNVNKNLKVTLNKIINHELVAHNLPANTEIKLYYTYNGLTTIMGYYKLTEDKNVIYTSDFYMLNSDDFMFNNQTFGEFFDITEEDVSTANISASEGYYFVITPPNGYSSGDILGNSFIDCIATVGYVDSNENYLTTNRYTFNEDSTNKPPFYDQISKLDTHILKDESFGQKGFTVYNSRITKLDYNDSHVFSFYDEYYTINYDGQIYVNPGDWRHQNKYFMLGVQLYFDSVEKTPIDLSGLKLSLYKDDLLIDEQAINIISPVNAVYFPSYGSGNYYVEVSVVDEESVEKASGFTQEKPYGLFVVLLESESTVKPAMGELRSDINITIHDMNEAKLWSDLNIKRYVRYDKNLNLPTVNALGNNIEWTYNGNVIDPTASASIFGTDSLNDTDVIIKGTINIAGQAPYYKEYTVNIMADPLSIFNSILNTLTFEDHMVNPNRLSEYGVISNNALLKDIIEIPNSHYRLQIVSYDIDDSEINEIVENNMIYGWLGQDDDSIKVTYNLIRPNGNIIEDTNYEKTYSKDNKGNNLSIANSDIALEKYTLLHEYINNSMPYYVPNVIIAMDDSDLLIPIEYVEWQEIDNVHNHIIANNGQLTINHDNQIGPGDKCNGSMFNIVYTNHEASVDRQYVYSVRIFIPPQDFYSNVIFNVSNPNINNYVERTESMEFIFSNEENNEKYIVSKDVTLNVSTTSGRNWWSPTTNWTFNSSGNKYTSSQSNTTLTIVLSLENGTFLFKDQNGDRIVINDGTEINASLLGLQNTITNTNCSYSIVKTNDSTITITVTSYNNISNINYAEFSLGSSIILNTYIPCTHDMEYIPE